MSDLQDIKKKIYDDDRIEDLLHLLGCKYIHREGHRMVAALPDGNNKRSVQIILNDNLTSNIRTRGGIKGDIFSIVSFIQFGCTSQSEVDDNLFDAKMWIVEEFGYHGLLSKGKGKEEKKNWNSWLKDIKKKRSKTIDLDNVKPNNPIPESIKNSYRMLPYMPWIKEGITWETQVEWEVGACWESHRVVTLIRNLMGDLIGVKGRAMDDNNPWKYLYIEPMNKSIELFGLHKTLPYILEQKEIILFEGYKSVFKAWQYGYKNVASIEGDDISPAQVALIKSLGLDVKIVVCYDKDKSEEDIQEQLNKFTNRKVYYTYDEEKKSKSLLTGKDSPVDKGVKTWEKLYDKKIEYTP